MPRHLRVDDRLHDRTQEQRVVSSDQMNGGTHDDDPDQFALLDQPAERLGLEVGET